MNSTSSRLSRAAACCALAGMSVACATVTRGTSQTWTVNSVPPGAAVKTTNGFSCAATPCTFKIKRKAAFEVAVTKEGFRPYSGHVEHDMSTGGGVALAGNVLIGGIIGLGVDGLDGASMELAPNPMMVTLEPLALPPIVPAVAVTPTPTASVLPASSALVAHKPGS